MICFRKLVTQRECSSTYYLHCTEILYSKCRQVLPVKSAYMRSVPPVRMEYKGPRTDLKSSQTLVRVSIAFEKEKVFMSC